MHEDPTQDVLTPDHLLYDGQLNKESIYNKNISKHHINVIPQATKLNNILQQLVKIVI